MGFSQNKKVVLVIAPSNFQDEELFDTKAELDAAGASTTIASSSMERATGRLGASAKPALMLSELRAEDFDAVVFVGGSGSAAYFNDKAALELARRAYALGKVVAAICIAPSILANAGILSGKNATSYPSERSNLESKGAKCTGKELAVDGRIITANGPKAAKAFGRAIAQALTR